MSESDKASVVRASWLHRPHDILIGFLALILCYVPALILGIGASPCFLFAGALLIAVVASVISRRSKRSLRVELAALTLVVILSTIICYWTAHPSPRYLFFMAFGVEPPAGVTKLEGRVQWFDGKIILLRFQADEATLKQAMSARNFLPNELLKEAVSREETVKIVKNHFYSARIADPTWIDAINLQSPILWHWQPVTVAGSLEQTSVLVNEKNDVWVLYNSQ